MYRIRIDQSRLSSLTETYLSSYKDKLRSVIEDFLDGETDCVFRRKVGTSKNGMTFQVKVRNNSFTHSFLKDCADKNNILLDDLLVGDIQKQIAIIKRVYEDDHAHFDSLTLNKAKEKGYVDGCEIDDFNAIMQEIFVTRFFDTELDKKVFVKDLGVRLCPYCGRAYIYSVEKKGKNGSVIVKPQLDHFLPKQSYPFLGMNFFNLIPCCSVCNMVPLKMTNDPLDPLRSKVTKLMHPYQFDEGKIRFFYQLNTPDTYDPNSSIILVGYKDENHKSGYNGFLAIDKLYAGHQVELNNMFLRSRAFHAATNGFYEGLGIKDSMAAAYTSAILGFHPSRAEESRQLLYKFKKDLFFQMISKSSFDPSEYYVDVYVDGEEKEAIVSI